jgi:hypothetical protein
MESFKDAVEPIISEDLEKKYTTMVKKVKLFIKVH